MIEQFALDQLLWTGRLALAAVFLIWVKRRTVPRKPHPTLDARLELWMDLTLTLMACSWGTWLILLWDPSNSIQATAQRLDSSHAFATSERLEVLTNQRLGISFAHGAVILLSLPVYIALRRRQDRHLRATL